MSSRVFRQSGVHSFIAFIHFNTFNFPKRELFYNLAHSTIWYGDLIDIALCSSVPSLSINNKEFEVLRPCLYEDSFSFEIVKFYAKYVIIPCLNQQHPSII